MVLCVPVSKLTELDAKKDGGGGLLGVNRAPVNLTFKGSGGAHRKHWLEGPAWDASEMLRA